MSQDQVAKLKAAIDDYHRQQRRRRGRRQDASRLQYRPGMNRTTTTDSTQPTTQST